MPANCMDQNFSIKIFFIDLREKEREEERERERDKQTLICCSTYLCIHWLILVCAMTRGGICHFGISGWTELSSQSHIGQDL